ncbi:MAG TPA: type II secretion system F family protein [Mycobacteriales bacterium]|nr:type II secretion system F family protein [Mycobacteriales bacterium]
MTPALTGAAVGLLGAGGVLVAVSASPPLRRPRLHDRLAPYLDDAPRPSRLLHQPVVNSPFASLDRLLGPVLRDAARWCDRLIGGTTSVRRRLEQAADDTTLEQFRVEQVIWGAAGLLLGLAVTAVAAARGSSTRPAAFLFVALALAVAGVLARDRMLTVAVARRERRMLAEFPTIAELLALAVGAGEGAIGALSRVTSLAGGELASELGRALADARSGASLVSALERMAARTSLPALARFVDGIAVAVERGTPLADVLRAQAVDVREEGRRRLLESAGRKEIAMLLPVVFFVLPVTVVLTKFQL